jgi:hypothetical protein
VIETHALTVQRFTEGMDLPEFKRLVVLVPDRDVDEVRLARKIWSLLPRRRVQVLFVTLVTDSNYGPGAQRRLVTLAALTQDVFYQIETRVIFGPSWTRGLAELVRPGDVVVCHASQQVRSPFRKGAALDAQILEKVKAPVYVLDGLYPEAVSPHPRRLVRLMVSWGILVGILIGFFVFEADVERLASGWLANVLFMMIFVLEVALIWAWNFLRI